MNEHEAMVKAAYLDAARAAIKAYLGTTDYPDKNVILAIIFGEAPKKEENE
jgi:hypothetical protein